MTELKTSGWLSADEVAKVLDVSPQTVGRIIGRGELIAHRIGNQWRISPFDLREYIAATRNEPPKKKPLILHSDIDQTMQVLRVIDYSDSDAPETARKLVEMTDPFRLYATTFDDAMKARFVELLAQWRDPDAAGFQVIREFVLDKEGGDG